MLELTQGLSGLCLIEPSLCWIAYSLDMKLNITNLLQSTLCKRSYFDSLWSLGNVKNNRNSKRQFAFPGILISPALPCPPISFPCCLSVFPAVSLARVGFLHTSTLGSAGNIPVTSFGGQGCLLPFSASVPLLLSLWEFKLGRIYVILELVCDLVD